MRRAGFLTFFLIAEVASIVTHQFITHKPMAPDERWFILVFAFAAAVSNALMVRRKAR